MLALTISNQRSRMDLLLLLPTNRIPNKAHAHGQQKARFALFFAAGDLQRYINKKDILHV